MDIENNNTSFFTRLQELVSWLEELQMKFHDPPTAKYAPKNGQMKICLTVGSQDGLNKVWAIYKLT